MTDLADLKSTALSLQGRGPDPREAYFSDRKKELCPTWNCLTVTRAGLDSGHFCRWTHRGAIQQPAAGLVCSRDKAHSKCLLCACCAGRMDRAEDGDLTEQPSVAHSGSSPGSRHEGRGERLVHHGQPPPRNLLPAESENKTCCRHTGTESLNVSESSSRMDGR